MTARKIDGKPLIQIFTHHPKYFEGLRSFPGIDFMEYGEEREPFEVDDFLVRCPSEEVAHKLSHFIRAYSRQNSL